MNLLYSKIVLIFVFISHIKPKLIIFMRINLASLFLTMYLFTTTTYAQKNLREAIIVSNNGDTTNGFIDIKEWVANPEFFSFATAKGAPLSRFSIGDIQYFNIKGVDEYIRYKVNVSMDEESLSSIGEKDTSFEVRTVFLKTLVKGKNVSLFSYTDHLKRRFYLLEKNDATPTELLNSVYILNGQLKEDRQYRSMLTSAAIKYITSEDNLLFQIDHAGFNAADIISICSRLNGKVESENTTKFDGKKSVAWRILAGVGINDGSLTMSGDNIFSGINSKPFYFPLALTAADLMITPEVGKIVLRSQLHITNYKTDGYVFKDFAQYTEEYFFKFKQLNIAFTPQLLYNLYNQKNLKWFLGAGAGFNFSSYPTNELKFVRKSSTNSGGFIDNYLQLKKFWMNLCFSTGVDINRMELAFVFLPKTSITRTLAYGLDNSSLQLHAAFYLKK